MPINVLLGLTIDSLYISEACGCKLILLILAFPSYEYSIVYQLVPFPNKEIVPLMGFSTFYRVEPCSGHMQSSSSVPSQSMHP